MNRLKQILDTMDVPEVRKNDLRWLGRNLWIRNSNHLNLKEALSLIKEKDTTNCLIISEEGRSL